MHEHALSNLRYIREAMERASAFTSIPGWGGVAIGATAVLTAIVAGSEGVSHTWLWLWLCEALLAALIGIVTMMRKAARSNVSFRSAPARRFFASYLASLVAGAVLTFLLARQGALAALPAVWLLLYGASFISSGTYSIPVVPVMGACFMFLGIVACFVPFAIANALLGIGFGGLHIAFGWIIATRYGG